MDPVNRAGITVLLVFVFTIIISYSILYKYYPPPEPKPCKSGHYENHSGMANHSRYFVCDE